MKDKLKAMKSFNGGRQSSVVWRDIKNFKPAHKNRKPVTFTAFKKPRLTP